MALAIYEQVLGLEVPVYDAFAVHVAEGEQDLADVEHGDVVAEPAVLAQPVEQLAARAVLKYHVDEALVLEGGLQRVDEGVVELHEDLLLQLDVLDLLQVYHVAFGQLLEGEHLLGGADDLLDPAEGARAQGLDDFVLGYIVRVFQIVSRYFFGLGSLRFVSL